MWGRDRRGGADVLSPHNSPICRSVGDMTFVAAVDIWGNLRGRRKNTAFDIPAVTRNRHLIVSLL